MTVPMDHATIPEQPKPPARHGNQGSPVGVLINLAISIFFWLFFGAMGYSQWAIDSGKPGDMGYEGTFVMSCYAEIIALGFFFAFAYNTWPRSAGGFLVSSIISFGVATLYTVFFGISANYFQAMFCTLSGAYLGLVTEYFTGGSRRLAEHMQATSEEALVKQAVA